MKVVYSQIHVEYPQIELSLCYVLTTTSCSVSRNTFCILKDTAVYLKAHVYLGIRSSSLQLLTGDSVVYLTIGVITKDREKIMLGFKFDIQIYVFVGQLIT